MSTIPKSAGFSFKTETSPFPFQQPQAPAQPEQPFDITKLPAELQQVIAKAYGTVPQPPQQGWSPSKAPQVQHQANPDGSASVEVKWPGPQPAAPSPPAQANMPPWIANQFGGQQQQQQPVPVQQQQQQPPPQQQYSWTPQPQPQPVMMQQQQPPPSGKPRVMICICSQQLVDTRFAAMMMRLPTLAAIAGCEWGYMADWRMGLAETRMEMIVNSMSIPGVTHVMFLDADMIIRGDDALALMLQDNLPLVSGVYWNSLGSGLAAWVQAKTIGLEQASPVLPVEQVGMGCCLIKTEVFHALKQAGAPWPWFYYHIDSNKPREFYGEDFFFQHLCTQVGVVPYVDFRVKVSHIKPTVYEWNGEMHMQEYG